MRQRLLGRRGRSMARRPGPPGRPDLSPRARTIGGWVAALLLVLGVAGAVRFFGESGAGGIPGPGASDALGTPLAITFGTVLTPARLIPVDARSTTFERGDTFAYAVEEGAPTDRIFVEISRTGGGTIETVQAPVSEQLVPEPPGPIAFSVPAANLLDAWGPGEYRMRIHLEADGPAVAEGSFVLAEAAASP